MDFKENLQKVFKNNNIDINENQLELFQIYYENLVETNKIHNLTAITDQKDVIIKHFLDSVIITNYLREIEEKNIKSQDIIQITNQTEDKNIHSENCLKIIDIGCGAGFPSIPLKIMNKNLSITAIDSVGKKIDFVNDTIKKLKLQDRFTSLHTRIEDLANKADFRENFDIVVSRAVAPLNIILEYSAPFLKNGGYIYSYKGSNYQEELKLSENAMKVLDCTLEKVLQFDIPEMETSRYVLVIKKNSKISTKYPRKQNKPRTNPL